MTSNSTTSNFLTQNNQIMIITIISLLLVGILWVLISLIYYGITREKWGKQRSSVSSKLNDVRIHTSVVACAFFCVLYYTSSLVFASLGKFKGSQTMCSIVGDISTFAYFLVVLSFNVFLWSRQRVLYKNRLLNVQFNKKVQIFSYVSIIIVFCGGFSAAVLGMLGENDMISTEFGCIYNPNTKYRSISIAVAAGFLFFGQISLLGLLVYPLKKSIRFTSKKFKVTRVVFFCCSRKEITDNQNPTTIVQSTIRKTLCFTILSVLCDSLC